YYEWLKNQPAQYQDEVLGKTRAKLFRDGGMTVERFRALQLDKNFTPLTLDEIKAQL
ncbi:phage head morphogenesis protein, partial [Moraxella catarrhalis]|nr:phage head morphogenesis protein [Moraxella catarrhalis]MPW86956.1 phage head morphogenesis protein [Moraxella catarrhalis]